MATYTHTRGYHDSRGGNGSQSRRSQRQQAAAVPIARCPRCQKLDDVRLIEAGCDLGCRQAANMKGAA